jgi:protein-tyrosine-phosphatase
LANSLGVPVPDTIRIDSLDIVEPVTDFPVVLKPVRSKLIISGQISSVVPVIVNNEQDRLARLRAWIPHTAVLQQSYISGRGVGLEFLYDHGRKVWQFAHERVHEWPLTGGGSTYRRSVSPAPMLLAAAEALLDALQWHGVAMVEYKVRSDGGFWLMEINPRLWGSLALAIDVGVNFPLGLLTLAQDQVPPPQPNYKGNYFTRNLVKDVKWMKANSRADHENPLLMTRPRLVSVLEYLRPLIGNESWDHFDVRDLGVTIAGLRQVMAGSTQRATTFLRKRLLARRLVRRHDRRYGTSPDFRRQSIKRLLFLCHGNICRSPFAAELARTKLSGYEIESAGFHDSENRCPPNNVVNAADSMGIHISESRSRRVTGEQIARADLILVMDTRNYELLAREFPKAPLRTTLLGLFGPQRWVNIKNPYGASESETHRVLKQISLAIDGLSVWLAASEAPKPRPTEVAAVRDNDQREQASSSLHSGPLNLR